MYYHDNFHIMWKTIRISRIISWQAFQTAQLMFMGLMVLIFLINIKNERWRERFRIYLSLYLWQIILP
jgi:hypothetical protein